MKLREFIENFVCKNTLIRLWYKTSSGHRVACPGVEGIVEMEWKVLKGHGPNGKFLNNQVVGVTDILVTDSHYPEAVNIVIEEQ